MWALITGVIVVGMWAVVCYSLCRVASMASRQEEEEARKRDKSEE